MFQLVLKFLTLTIYFEDHVLAERKRLSRADRRVRHVSGGRRRAAEDAHTPPGRPAPQQDPVV